MMSGLIATSADDALLGEWCTKAELALGDHDPACQATAAAAEAAVQAARRVLDVLGEDRVERLEHALRSAQQLHALMASSLRNHLEASIRELESRFWEDTPGSLRTTTCGAAVVEHALGGWEQFEDEDEEEEGVEDGDCQACEPRARPQA